MVSLRTFSPAIYSSYLGSAIGNHSFEDINLFSDLADVKQGEHGSRD